MAVPKENPKQQLKRNEIKWTKLVMDAGYTMFPSVIILRQHALKLDSVDLNIILYLAMRWWYPERLPYPTKASMAETMRLTPRTVQRHLARLEKLGYIARMPRYSGEHKGQQANHYDLAGLIAKLAPFAQEEIDLKEANKREQAEKPTRLRPRRLHLVKTEVAPTK
jgi:DNA-binding transcriptional ArsR family regulator